MMATALEIPLSPRSQTFFCALGGTEYRLTVIWREAVGGGWFLDIADPEGGVIVNGIALVAGVDLLEPYRSLGFTAALLIVSTPDEDADPTYEGLGTTSRLYAVPL